MKAECPQGLNILKIHIMHISKLAFLLLFVTTWCRADDTVALLKETKELRQISGSAVGLGAQQGRFSEIAKLLQRELRNDDLVRLAKDGDPEVSCMGLVLLAGSRDKNLRFIQSFEDDQRSILLNPVGCDIQKSTVGDFAKTLASDVEFRAKFLSPGNIKE